MEEMTPGQLKHWLAFYRIRERGATPDQLAAKATSSAKNPKKKR
jgi:hypothetical protein